MFKDTLTPKSGFYLYPISNSIEKGNDFGDASFSTNLHYYSIIYFSNYQIVPAVKCTEKKGCEYKIHVVNEIDDLRYAKVSYGKNIHKYYDNLNSNFTKLFYEFNVDDENISSIKIELNSMYFI